MRLENVLDIIAVVLSFIAIVVSAFFAYKSHCAAEEQNKLSEEQNRLSEEANQINERLTRLTSQQLAFEVGDRISSFDLRLVDIDFTNDAFKCSSIDEALSIGGIKCIFLVENLTNNVASYVQIVPSCDYPSDGDNMRINEKEHATTMYLFQAYRFLNSKYLYSRYGDAKTDKCNKKLFRDKAVLRWNNGMNIYSCEFAFEFFIEEYDKDENRYCRVGISGDGHCTMLRYKKLGTQLEEV